ncbi:MAG TPA: hypothetical protein VG964_02710 [Candidatus Saccharimonadales bacterium]|nr:hypothetical protein [Candidatus Saccharimonadales bacterium]
MSSIEEYNYGEAEISRDWRDDLIDSLEDQGFYKHVIVPQPPRRPTKRVVKRWTPTYDYDTIELPWDNEEDRIEAENHAFLRRSLIKRYGFGNVTTAFPTQAMIRDNPRLGEEAHHMFMVRPPENIPEEITPEQFDAKSLMQRIAARVRGK